MALDDTVFGVGPQDDQAEVTPQAPADDPMGVVRDLAQHALSDPQASAAVDPRTVMKRLVRKAVEEYPWDKPFPKPDIPEPTIPTTTAPVSTKEPGKKNEPADDFSEFAAPQKPGQKPAGGGVDDFSEFAEQQPGAPGAQPEQPGATAPPEGEPGHLRTAVDVFQHKAVTGTGETLKATERGLQSLQNAQTWLGRKVYGWFSGEETPGYGEKVKGAAPQETQFPHFGEQKYGEPAPVEGRPIYQAGAALKQRAEEKIPISKEQEESLVGQVAGGLGSFVPTAASLAVGGVLGGPLGAMAFGATQMAGTAHEQSFEKALAAGATEEQAAKAAGLDALVGGGLGMLPLGMILAPVRRYGPGLAGWAAMKLEQAARAGMTFATVGEAQTWLSEKIASEYNPKAGYEGDLKRFMAAFLTGAIIGGVTPAHEAKPGAGLGESIKDTFRPGGLAFGPPSGTPPPPPPRPDTPYTDPPDATPFTPDERTARSKEWADLWGTTPGPTEAELARGKTATRPPTMEVMREIFRTKYGFTDADLANTSMADLRKFSQAADILQSDGVQAWEIARMTPADMSQRVAEVIAKRNGGTAPPPPPPGAEAKGAGAKAFGGLSETEVNDLLRSRNWSDADIKKMHPDNIRAEVKDALDNGWTPTKPGTREKPVSPEDLGKAGETINGKPSPDQRAALNYQSIHTELPELGLSGRAGITIETNKGGTREGPMQPLDETAQARAQANLETLQQTRKAEVNARQPTENTDQQIAQIQDQLKRGSPAWTTPNMPLAYGRAKQIKGADGDGLDFFVGEKPAGGPVIVIDQLKKDGSFDEHKVLARVLGPGEVDPRPAVQAYIASYSDDARSRIGAVSMLTPEMFQTWTKNGRVPKRPYSNDLHEQLKKKRATRQGTGGAETGGPKEPAGGGLGESPAGLTEQPATEQTVPPSSEESSQPKGGIDELTNIFQDMTGEQAGGPRTPSGGGGPRAPVEQPAPAPVETGMPAEDHHATILAAFKANMSPAEFAEMQHFDALIDRAAKLMKDNGWDVEQSVSTVMAEYAIDLGLTNLDEIGAINGEHTRDAVEQAQADTNVSTELPPGHGVQDAEGVATTERPATETPEHGVHHGSEVGGNEAAEGATNVGQGTAGPRHPARGTKGSEGTSEPVQGEESVQQPEPATEHGNVPERASATEAGEGETSGVTEPVDYDRELREAAGEIGFPYDKIPEDVLSRARLYMEQGVKDAAEALAYAGDEATRAEIGHEEPDEHAEPGTPAETKGGTGREQETAQPGGTELGTGQGGGPRTPRKRGESTKPGGESTTGTETGTGLGGPREPVRDSGPNGEPVAGGGTRYAVGDLVKVKSGNVYRIDRVVPLGTKGYPHFTENNYGAYVQRARKGSTEVGDYGPHRWFTESTLDKYNAEQTPKAPKETGGPKIPTTVPVTEAERAKYNQEITINNGKKTERVQVQMDPVWSEGDHRFAAVGYRWVKTKKQWAEKSSTYSFVSWEPYKEPEQKPKKGKEKTTGGPKEPGITDTGERIEGARKHAWENTGLTDEQIGGMTEAEKGKHLTKTNIWPRPDYQAIIDEGTTPKAAFAIKLFYDGLPSQPHALDQRDQYIDLMRKVREIAKGIKTWEDVDTAAYKLNEQTGAKNGWDIDWDKLKPLLRGTKNKRSYGGIKYKYEHPLNISNKDKNKIDAEIEKGWPNIEPFNKSFYIERAWHSESDGYKFIVQRKSDYAKLLSDDSFSYYDDKGELKPNVFKKVYATREEAQTKARELYEAQQKEGGGDETSGPKEPKRPILDTIKREGPERRKGRTITAEDYANDKGKSYFDFRGLQWGNYVRETKGTTMRQDLLDAGWDALHDMAAVLGLPPKALSLQGPFRLAIAFGARGHGGKVNATYAPHQAIINLTLWKGAGTFAHEFGHALDHFLGELGQANPYQSAFPRTISGWDKVQSKAQVGTYEWKKGGTKLTNLPPKLQKAALDVMQALHFQRESPEEALKRHDAAVKSAETSLESWKKTAADARVLLKKGPNKYASAHMKKADQQVPIWEREVNRIKYSDVYRKLVPTEFYGHARKLSGKSGTYWHRPTELLARSYEAYIYDKLKEIGIDSPYLVQGVEEGRYTVPTYAGNPYPAGRERRVINQKYDALFQALQADKDGKLTGVPGEAVQDNEDWRVKRSYGTQKLSDSFATHLRAEGFKDITAARAFAKEEGFTDLDHKQIEEQLELGVVKRAREITSESHYRDGVKPQQVFDQLMELYNRQPRLTARTSTSVREQAYSTPVPLAYIASYLAGITPETTVFEPTAGNGALLIDARASKVTVNEINPDRKSNLVDLGLIPTMHDATDPKLYESVTPTDVVIMNPPFGAVKDSNGNSVTYDMSDVQKGYKTKEVDHVIALRALGAMRDEGRAVVILGGLNKLTNTEEKRSQAYQGKAKREFYKALYDRYNVTDHFTVSGDLYERQGASWPVDVLVIDGRTKSARKLPASSVPRVIDTWDQLRGLLNEPKPVVRKQTERPYKPGEGSAGGDEGDKGQNGGTPDKSGGTGGPRTPKPVRGGGGDEQRPDESGGPTRPEAGGESGGPVGQPGERGGPVGNTDEGMIDAGLDNLFGTEEEKPSLERATNRTPAGEATRFTDWKESLAYMKERIKYWSGLSEHGYFDNLIREKGRTSLEPAKYDRIAQLEQEIAADNRISHDHLMIANSTADVPGQEHLGRPWSGEIQGYHDHFNSLIDRLERNAKTKALLDDARRRLAPTSEVAKETVKSGLKGVDELTSALTDLLGGDKNQANMPGGGFDRETYEKKVKPHLIEAARNFKEFKDNLQELVNRLLKHLRDIAKWTKAMFEAFKPYLVEFVKEVRTKVINLFGEATEQKPAKPGQATTDMETEHQGVYRPQSDIKGLTTLAPKNMIRSMEDALERVSEEVGDIDKWVADELGYGGSQDLTNYLGAEQVDALALAIYEMKNNGGFIIGDQTGIGKGRVNAAIIRWAIKNDLTPVFMTAKRGLYADMYRDLSAVGIQEMLGREPKIMETNSAQDRFPLDDDENVVLDASKAGDKAALFEKLKDPAVLRKQYDMVFTNYSQATGEVSANRRAFLDALAPHALFILDESHLAGGEVPTRAKKDALLNLGGYMRDLLSKVQLGTFFSSATYAKRPTSMIVYSHATGMNLAVANPNELAEAIERGRVPMQEVVATMLAQDGKYIRRERSFKGINFHTDETPVSGGSYPNIASSFQQINDFSKYVARLVKNLQGIKDEGVGVVPDFAVGDNSLIHTGFTSVMHNIVGNMLLAMKVNRTIDKIKERGAAGEKPLIMLAKTGEKFLEDFIKDYNEDQAALNPPGKAIEPGSPVPATFNDVLHRYLERSRIVLLKPPFQEEEGKKKPKPVRHYLTDDELGPRGLELYHKAREYINSFALPDMPVDPISYIRDTVAKDGISMGEITGRGWTLDYSKGGVPTLRVRPGGETTTRGKAVTAKRFNNGELHGIIYNRSGSTGISLHASETFKDQSPRHTIIIDPEADINEFMQGLGRANRTGQVNLPIYTIMVTDLPAETRPTSLLMKKLASLNANTTGARGGNIALDVPDFFNMYGDDIAKSFLEDNHDIAEMLDLASFDPETGRWKGDEPIRKVFGRLPLLPPDVQDSILDHIGSEYENYMEALNAAGENGLMAQKLDLRAKALERTEVVSPKEGGAGHNSSFAAGVDVIKAKVRRLSKPYSSREVVTQLGAGLGYAPDTLFPKPEYTPAQILGKIQPELYAAHQATKRQALADFDAYMRKALEDVPKDRFEKEQTRLRNNRTRWESVMDMLPNGGAVRLQTNGGNVTGFVVYSQRQTEPVNPLAMGSWKAKVLAADANQKMLTIPFSRLYAGRTSMDDVIDEGLENDPNSIGVVPIRDEHWEDTLSRFDNQQGDVYEERYIATGNLLAAYNWLKNKGMIIHYTDNRGVLQQGILTAKNWELGKHVQDRGRIAQTAEELLSHIDSHYDSYARSPKMTVDADNVIGIGRKWEGYIINTVSAKRTGGYYYTNTNLTDLTGDFIKSGKRMEVVVPADKIRPVLELLLKLGAKFKLPPKRMQTEKVPDDGGEEAMFLGDRSLLFDTYAADKAKSMSKLGVSADKIWDKTGYVKDPVSKQWYFELDDSKVQFSPKVSENEWKKELKRNKENDNHSPTIEVGARLGELIHHPELFEAVPALANVHVFIGVGSYYGTRGQIGPDGIEAHGETWQQMVPVLMHEIQHYVDAIQGEHLGTFPEAVIRRNNIAIDAITKEIDELELTGKPSNRLAMMNGAREAIRRALARMGSGMLSRGPSEGSISSYEASQTERRARETMHRVGLTEKQRRKELPEAFRNNDVISPYDPVGLTFQGEDKARMIIEDVMQLYKLRPMHQRWRLTMDADGILARLTQHGATNEIGVGESWMRGDKRLLEDALEGRMYENDEAERNRAIIDFKERVNEAKAYIDIMEALQHAGFEKPVEQPFSVPVRELLDRPNPPYEYEPVIKHSDEWNQWRREQLAALREWELRRARRKVEIGKIAKWLFDNKPLTKEYLRGQSLTEMVQIVRNRFDGSIDSLRKELEEYGLPQDMIERSVKVFEETEKPSNLDYNHAQYLEPGDTEHGMSTLRDLLIPKRSDEEAMATIRKGDPGYADAFKKYLDQWYKLGYERAMNGRQHEPFGDQAALEDLKQYPDEYQKHLRDEEHYKEGVRDALARVANPGAPLTAREQSTGMPRRSPGGDEAMASRKRTRPEGWQPKPSLNGMEIGLPAHVTDAAGLRNGRAWVNYNYIAGKHPEYFTDAADARAKIEPVLAAPEYVFSHPDGNVSLAKGDYLVSLNPSATVLRYNVPTAYRLDPGQLKRQLDAARARNVKITDMRSEAMASPEITQFFDALEGARNKELELPNGGILYVRNEDDGKVLNLSHIRYAGDDSTEMGGSPNVMQNLRIFSLLEELEKEATRRGYRQIKISAIQNERLIPFFSKRGYVNDQLAIIDEIARAQPSIPRAQIEALFGGGSPHLVKNLKPVVAAPALMRPAISSQMAAIQQDLSTLLSRMLGSTVNVQFPSEIPTTDSMRVGYGGDIGDRVNSSYVRGLQLIKIVARSSYARQGAYHEAIHFMEDWLATDREKALFDREVPRLRQQYRKIFGQGADKLNDREVRAGVGSVYLTDRERGEGTQGVHIGLRAFWEKVKRVMTQVSAWLREKLGLSTFEDVLDRMYEGRMSRRPPRKANVSGEEAASRDPQMAAFMDEMKQTYGVTDLPVDINKLSEHDKLRYELMRFRAPDMGYETPQKSWSQETLDVLPERVKSGLMTQDEADTKRAEIERQMSTRYDASKPTFHEVPSMEPYRIAQDMRRRKLDRMAAALAPADPFKNPEYNALVFAYEESAVHLADVDKVEQQMAEKYGPDWQNKMEDTDHAAWAWVNHEAAYAIEDALKEREYGGDLTGAISNDPMFKNLDNPTELAKFKREWGEEAMANPPRRWNDDEVAQAIDWLARSKLGDRKNDAVAVRAAKQDLVGYFAYKDPQDYVDLAIRQGMQDPRIVQLHKSEEPPTQYVETTEEEEALGKPATDEVTAKAPTIEERVVQGMEAYGRDRWTPQTVMESDIVWSWADRAARLSQMPFERIYAALVNHVYKEFGINAYLTEPLAARFIRVQRAKVKGIAGSADADYRPQRNPESRAEKLGRFFLERNKGDIAATKREIEEAISGAQERKHDAMVDALRSAHEFLDTLRDKAGNTITDQKVIPLRPRPRGDEEAMARRPPLSSDEQSIQDRLGTGERNRWFTSARDLWDWFYYKVKDDLDPIAVAEKAMNRGELVHPSDAFDSPYKLARITRGDFGRAEQMLKHSTYDFNTLENNGQSLKDVLKPVEDSIERFQIYAVARRAVELSDRGIRTGMPIERARRVVAAGRAQFEPHFQNLLGYQDRVLQYLRDSGILSADGYDRIKDLNDAYVPFYRIMGANSELGVQLSPGPGLRVRNPVFEIKGSGRRVVQPIESIVRNTFLFISLAERNRALRALKDLALRSPVGSAYMRRAFRPARPIDVTDDELNKFMRDEGIPYATTEHMTIFRPHPFRLDGNRIRLFENGKAYIYEVSPLVANAVNAMDRTRLSLLWRFLGFPAKLLRAGVILSPEYFPRNVVRDQLSAWVNSDNNYRILYDFGKGMGDVLFKDQTFQNWLKGGGANATFVGIDRRYVHDNIVNYTQLSNWQKIKNVVNWPINGLRFTTELLENSTRLGDFARSIESGTDIMEAGYRSREVTLDFMRHGGSAGIRAFNYITAFFNAQLEGIDRTIRQFQKSPGHAFAAMLKIALGIMLPSIMLWFWNKDDPRYQELPPYVRDFFWVFITDNWVKMTPALVAEKNDLPAYLRRQAPDGTWEYNQGNVWKLPKPFELGMLFGTIPERMLEAFLTDHPHAFKNLRSSVLQAFAPNILPQFMVPVLEHKTNFTFFTERPLLPDRLSKIEAVYQSQPYTTEVAKRVGGVIDKMSRAFGITDNSMASPIILENYIRQWTGGLGMHGLNAIDKVLEGSDKILGTKLTDQIVRPETTLSDIPVIKGFHARFPGADTVSIRDFYDLYQEREKANNTRKELQSRGENVDAQERQTLAQGAHRSLGRGFKTIREIYFNKELTPAEKRQLIDKTYYMMIETAKEGLNVMNGK